MCRYGSPNRCGNLVVLDWKLFTKVCERSRAVKNQQSFVTTKCWYSQSLQVAGRCKASTYWRRHSSTVVISFRMVFSQPAGSSWPTQVSKVTVIKITQGPTRQVQVRVEPSVQALPFICVSRCKTFQDKRPTFLWARFHRLRPISKNAPSYLVKPDSPLERK